MAIFAKTFRCLLQIVAVLLLVCELSNSAGKSENGCVVCGKKSQSRPFQKVEAYVKELEFCFGVVLTDGTNAGVICEGCRRAVQEHRRTGKRFHHVSNNIETLLNIQCASIPVNLNTFCKKGFNK